MFLISVLIFLLSGYYFILKLIEAVQDVGSHRFAALLFIIWASSGLILAAQI
ncbi:hypothetical protein V1502_10270 [Bacillus sp. SCS-153A]|uniref:hypothetical protein n=1 Tax=Rossellomorea sedimentorum TaxID=3115294 RepID=UPI003905A6AB